MTFQGILIEKLAPKTASAKGSTWAYIATLSD